MHFIAMQHVAGTHYNKYVSIY